MSSLRRWSGFAAMCLGMFAAILDVQIVATALPDIGRALGVSPDQMSWVQTGYLIAEVVVIPLTGLMLRLLSLRGLFVAAMAGFTAASLGCALAEGFPALIFWRVVQGASGGLLIPVVFSAVFLIFPPAQQGRATTLAGVLAVLAPSVGPLAGGWITQTWSWHWLFLVNLGPGTLAAVVAALALPRERSNLGLWRQVDLGAVALLALSLSSLVIALKQAPGQGWASGLVLGLLGLALAAGVTFVRRSLGAAHPIVDLRALRDRSFALGCVFSFVLGIGLYGSVYLMPVFLALVGGRNALETGQVMLATGFAQLAMAPLAVALERRVETRLLTGIGFAVLAVGLGLSAFQTPQTDGAAMVWPQVLRGAAIMFCLLPPTRMAPEKVADASGLFNLMRNLGGAIGLALVDTVIYGRAPGLGAAVAARVAAGDPGALAFLGSQSLPQAALTLALNEAWGLIALLTAAALCGLPFLRKSAALLR